MAQQLFRQEALAHQDERLWGGCLALNPVGLSVLTWLFLALALFGGVFLVTGNYQRKAVVTGVLVSNRGNIQVRAPAAGMVEEVTAGTGEWVGQGDYLLRLRAGTTKLDGADVTGRLLAENRRQESVLRQLLRDREAEYPIRRAGLAAEQQGMRLRKRRLESLIASEDAVYDLLAAQYSRQETLHARSLAPASDLDRARMELLKQEVLVAQARMELAEMLQALDRSEREARLLALEHARTLGELERSLSEIRKQDVRLRAEQAVELSAPVTGTVAVLLVKPGETVVAGQPLLNLVPVGSMLEAELHVPSRAMGFLREGLPVNLRLDAFPYQKFGMHAATVREIASTPILPADSGQGGAAEPYFRVEATLAHQVLNAYGNPHSLRPGMRFRADVVLERRSLLEWLLEPLFIQGRLSGGQG